LTSQQEPWLGLSDDESWYVHGIIPEITRLALSFMHGSDRWLVRVRQGVQ
jgi:hypothetical protein